jgi:L-seryl-tRNA(Ser) seleniumtransferase
METISRSYSNLEFDLETGKRGSRLVHPESLLRRLTGAEDAMVVNNNAAAVLLVLASLANRQRVIIARSQLIEIGGEFRLPDIMKQAGAKLVEVGTTNKTHLSDYKEALELPASLVMHAHTSNYQIIGFTGEPDWGQVVEVAHAHDVVCVDDLGSGAVLPTEKYGLAHEPTVQDSLSAGTDLVCFSGDKLLGGPQAGIILGKSELLARIKKHPLARAVRPDKLCLSALNATLQHYLRDEAEKEIPVWRMLSRSLDDIHRTAKKWAKEIGLGEVIAGQSAVGGGSLPGETLPTWLVSLDVEKPQTFLSELRHQSPPIIARIENDHILLDPRTVLPFQETGLLAGLSRVRENVKITQTQGG